MQISTIGRLCLAALLVLLQACSVAPSRTPAVDGRVVDGDVPTFSDPTTITNPLFPASNVTQLVHLGVDGGKPLRVEVTLMADTKEIEWDGQLVATVVVQFIAYRERRILEVAYDYFAQADDGSVWYFGESVDNYTDGQVSNHSGAWLAGKDGPPGMIMPADPRVGDVYHPENIPGLVFEELIVLETDQSVPGPSGEITGAIRVEEHLMEGNVEQKVFAPGYGEFQADAASEFVTVAVAVPTDSRSGPEPTAVASLVDGLGRAFAAARNDELGVLAAELAALREDWAEIAATGVPPLVTEEMDAAMERLADAVGAGDAAAAQQAAIDASLAASDVQLPFTGRADADLSRLITWARQLLVDADATDRPGIQSDVACLETVWARARGAASGDTAARVDELLVAIRDAAATGETELAATLGENLISVVWATSG